jgi:hypothetical protein
MGCYTRLLGLPGVWRAHGPIHLSQGRHGGEEGWSKAVTVFTCVQPVRACLRGNMYGAQRAKGFMRTSQGPLEGRLP